jgi:endonuclease III
VNQVTPVLFERWPYPRALASAAPAEVEGVIQSTGFFRYKTMAMLVESGLNFTTAVTMGDAADKGVA